ncbi:MAG: hypothetical protein ACYSWU_17100 [Planctomycetota bacterium]|jgi:hypothetical protein
MGDCRLRIEDCRLQVVLLALLCGITAGCSEKVDTDYGERKGAATYSVNGTAVLGEMFEAAGHEVYSWRWLSPRLQQRADCIVWFPDDFAPPSKNADGKDVRDWLEDWLLSRPDGEADYVFGDWLEEEPGRTLIYVCRDFDAAGRYWDKVKPGAPPEQAKRIEKAAAAAKSDFDILRQAIPDGEDCGWFTTVAKSQPRKVRTLEGPWAEGIDASKVEMKCSWSRKATCWSPASLGATAA